MPMTKVPNIIVSGYLWFKRKMLNGSNSSKDSFPTGISSLGLCYGSKGRNRLSVFAAERRLLWRSVIKIISSLKRT